MTTTCARGNFECKESASIIPRTHQKQKMFCDVGEAAVADGAVVDWLFPRYDLQQRYSCYESLTYNVGRQQILSHREVEFADC